MTEIAKACGINYEPDQSIPNETSRKEAEVAEELAKGVSESPVLIDFGPGGASGAAGGQPVTVTHSAGYPIRATGGQGGQLMMPIPGLPPLPSKPPSTSPSIPTDPNAVGFKPENEPQESPLNKKPGDSNNANDDGGGGHFFASPAGFDSNGPPPSYDSSTAAAMNRPASSVPPASLPSR